MGNTKDSYLSILKKQKIKKSILDVIEIVKKEDFFDPRFKDDIYKTKAIPIGSGQISDDPIMMAKMIQLLEPKENWRLLEIGTGSGYSTSILSHLVDEVVTIEYYEELARNAKKAATGQGLENITFFAGDATDMDIDLGEFDGVIVFTGCRQSPPQFLNVLKEKGKLLLPLGPGHQQQLTLFENILDSGNMAKNYKFFDFCKYASIRGEYGWIDLDTVADDIEGDDEAENEPEVDLKVSEESDKEKKKRLKKEKKKEKSR